MGELVSQAGSNPIFLVVIGCEIGFWVLLGGGLAARYLLRMRLLSTILLISVPLLDVVLLVATAIDLRGGGQAGQVHGLAAAYVGFSVAFGHSMVRWADQRFAHRFAGGPPPVKPPRYGAARVRYEWREWGKCLLAWSIACGLLLLLIFVIGSPDRSAALWQWITRLTTITVIWLVGWPLRVTLAPPTEPAKVDQ